MTNPFETVFDRLLTLIPSINTNPGTAMRATQLVHDWLAAGCDPQLDIIPTINRLWCYKSSPVTSPNYFDKAVRDAHQIRINSGEVAKKKFEFRRQALEWKKSKGMYLSAAEERELASCISPA